MVNSIPVHTLKLKQRDNVRDFPDRRWLNLCLRAVHLSGIVLLGAALLGADDVTVAARPPGFLAAPPTRGAQTGLA